MRQLSRYCTPSQKRGTMKSLITKMEAWVKDSAAQSSLCDLEVKLRQLSKYERQYDEIQNGLERLGNIEARLLERKNQITGGNFNESGIPANITVDLSSSVLPKMELPKFSGDYLEYPKFYDTFVNLVHNQTGQGMTHIRNFGLLKSCLER